MLSLPDAGDKFNVMSYVAVPSETVASATAIEIVGGPSLSTILRSIAFGTVAPPVGPERLTVIASKPSSFKSSSTIGMEQVFVAV